MKKFVLSICLIWIVAGASWAVAKFEFTSGQIHVLLSYFPEDEVQFMVGNSYLLTGDEMGAAGKDARAFTLVTGEMFFTTNPEMTTILHEATHVHQLIVLGYDGWPSGNAPDYVVHLDKILAGEQLHPEAEAQVVALTYVAYFIVDPDVGSPLLLFNGKQVPIVVAAPVLARYLRVFLNLNCPY